MDEKTLLEAWGRPAAAEHAAKKYFKGPHLAYYLPPREEGRLAVIAPSALVTAILERQGPPLLRASLERLLDDSDDQRHFTLLVTPPVLLAENHGLLVGDLEKVREPLWAFFDSGVEAVLASAQLGDALFVELRAVPRSDRRAEEIAGLARLRLEKTSERLESYVATLAPATYGRLVVNRFPRMVQLLADYTRAGVEDRQAVLRAYLPGAAAHNLLAGAELTLFAEPAAVASVAAQPPSAPSAPATAAAALDKKIDLGFPRDTLEHAIELLSKEIDVPITILGSDLQLEGITKNQSFALDERDRPAREVIKKVLALSNPQGKLVYVIKSQSGGGEAIFITTRAAAAKRNEPLPAE